jgi:hypothetical protein
MSQVMGFMNMVMGILLSNIVSELHSNQQKSLTNLSKIFLPRRGFSLLFIKKSNYFLEVGIKNSDKMMS